MRPAGVRSDDSPAEGYARAPSRWVYRGDARNLRSLTPVSGGAPAQGIPDRSVDLVVTSPPYWGKRDYGVSDQIGQERDPGAYANHLRAAIEEWRRVLRPTGSIFLNIGDTYRKKSLAGIPGLIEAKALELGLRIRNRIVWVKAGGHPDPVRDRLTSRHEYVLHLAVNGYYYDLFGYAERYSREKRGANPGDVWEVARERNLGGHLAPFPTDIARRAILLACPELVCTGCGQPRRRIVERTKRDLDLSRPQARRALELAREKNLTDEHIAAIQATGISDAGKARSVQTGTDRNAARVRELALVAKQALGGYFREFTFTKRRSVGWTSCGCGAPFEPGVVLDPFMGTGTTLGVAQSLGRSAIGVDLDTTNLRTGDRA